MATSGNANNNYKYDVFLNHRGPDVKKTIASCLYCWLTSTGLRVFLDYQELEEGQKLDTQIEEAIASASLHVAIFSPQYAGSTWCLEELHLMTVSGKTIIPIFYNVRPADLRLAQDHKGAYAAALDKHENNRAGNGQPRHNSTTVGKWRNALSSAANISGFDLYTFNGDEGMLLYETVKCVLKRVKKPHLVDVGKYTVGLDEKAQDFHRKVLSQQHGGRRVQVVGIAGPPGVGKTTLAKELFIRNFSNYDKSYFLFDVRENSKSSLPSLQKKILKGLIQLDQGVDNVDEGKWMLKKHLSKSRVLLVLDDVDDADDVDALLPVNVLHPESLVLITSRHNNVLKWSGMQEHSIYQLSGLDEHHSRELFCYYAFGQPHPKSEFEDLVHQFLKACNGVPSCLKEYGRLVFDNNNKSDWEDQLKKLLSTRHTDSPRSFEISYEIRKISYRIVHTVNTIGMLDQLRALGRILLEYLELVPRLWRGIKEFNGGIEEFNDLSHGGTEEFNGGIEEFNDLSHGGTEEFNDLSHGGTEEFNGGIEEFNDSSHGGTEEFNGGIEEFNDLGHGATEEFNGGIEEFTDLSHDTKKIVLKLLAGVDFQGQRRVMKRIISVEGVESVAFDGKEMKLTVIGSADPVYLMVKLRKFFCVELLSVGPAREIKFRRSE